MRTETAPRKPRKPRQSTKRSARSMGDEILDAACKFSITEIREGRQSVAMDHLQSAIVTVDMLERQTV